MIDLGMGTWCHSAQWNMRGSREAFRKVVFALPRGFREGSPFPSSTLWVLLGEYMLQPSCDVTKQAWRQKPNKATGVVEQNHGKIFLQQPHSPHPLCMRRAFTCSRGKLWGSLSYSLSVVASYDRVSCLLRRQFLKWLFQHIFFKKIYRPKQALIFTFNVLPPFPWGIYVNFFQEFFLHSPKCS